MSAWQLESIPWQVFDPTKVDAKLLAQAKGAALVESNAADYVAYLRGVFHDNPQLLAEIETWGEEEERHGSTLRKWCEMADPHFDYEAALLRFKKAYKIPAPSKSVRGSPARELVARCVVETGTSTFYTALKDACEEPLLKEICRRIAGDEIRHFNLFLKHLTTRYAREEHVGCSARLKTVLERVLEMDDPELTFAHFAANLGDDFNPQLFPLYAEKYMNEAMGYYRAKHFIMSAPMLAKTIGISLSARISHFIGRLMYGFFHLRYCTFAQNEVVH
jgi:rubrerythrin